MATLNPNNNNTADVGMGWGELSGNSSFLENVHWEVKGEQQESVRKKKKKEDYSFAQSLTDLGPLGELGGFSSLEDSLRIL